MTSGLHMTIHTRSPIRRLLLVVVVWAVSCIGPWTLIELHDTMFDHGQGDEKRSFALDLKS